jgi:hypothetical protein
VELVYNKDVSRSEYGSKKTLLDVEVPPNDEGTGVSTRTMLQKILAFQDHFIATIMLMFGIIALVAGLVSIFSPEDA